MSIEEQVKELNDWRKSIDEAVKIKLFGHTPSKKINDYTHYILDNYDNLIR